jgi:hypothetical protein
VVDSQLRLAPVALKNRERHTDGGTMPRLRSYCRRPSTRRLRKTCRASRLVPVAAVHCGRPHALAALGLPDRALSEEHFF